MCILNNLLNIQLQTLHKLCKQIVVGIISTSIAPNDISII